MKKSMKHVILMLSLVVLFSSPATAMESTRKAQGNPTNMPLASPDMVTTQEQEVTQEEKGERSQTARENMSVVAQAVQEFLAQDMEGGIGQQVREVTQAQKQAQTQIETEFAKMESRMGFVKSLFGPDFKAIKNLNQQVEQNQVRVQELKQLANQTQNQVDQTQLQEMIQVLDQQNTALTERVQAEERVGSIFGWLVKFFNR
jgi:hypothetical protein